MKKIIYHHPLPLNLNATSASGIRPLRMLAAFKALGYDVELVTGYSNERKQAIRKIKRNIDSGVKYDFMYSESSTMPTILTDKHHLPLHPFLDARFFSFCKKQNIPIGLFYRDIYWAFEGYGKELSFLKVQIAKLSYKYDLYNYNKYLSQLYLPSIEMGKYVPIVNKDIFKSLPPGHEQYDAQLKSKRGDSELNIFYVGGMSSHYEMHILLEVIACYPQVRLTICTREAEWLAVKNEYPTLTDNIKVVHKSGKEMHLLMEQADIVSIFVRSQEYWEFASPVKLYEYLGNIKPIIATKGSLAGEFVEYNKIGWTIPYTHQELKKFIETIIDNPVEIELIQKNMKRVAVEHTWLARAKQVVKDLVK
ncbi:glycosyltransferase [Pseudoalteromonas rhizosphaerae]|uniref:glycosyltransferase n=1 Tax=Pseudoalteromonas rhizosphaerae TaxID=2518973 RepID=UPI00384BA3DC